VIISHIASFILVIALPNPFQIAIILSPKVEVE